MANEKLDSASLSADEIHAATTKIIADPLLHRFYNWSVKSSRALFGTVTEKAQESAFPVGNCKVCGELVAPYNKHAKYEGGYTCQPAQPEPADSRQERADQIKSFLGGDDDEPAQLEPAAQGEMPDEVDRACDLLEWSGNVNAAAALRDAWLAHSQPVAVGMSGALERVLDCAEMDANRDRMGGHETTADRTMAAIREVRQQAAQGKPKVELPKVGIPVPVDALKRACATCSLDDCMTIAGWLDAVEGRK